METNAQKLRQKAINLLYLIFLAFLFSFIPSDFVDTTYQSNESLNLLCNEVERQSTKYNMLVLSYIEKNEELFDDTKLKLISIDEKTSNQIKMLEEMKYKLITKQGFNKFGYLKGGKSENPSNDFMIAEKNADRLYQSLLLYKADLAQLLSAEDAMQLDSILPLPALIRRSDGDYAKGMEFYFKKNPLNVAILNLSHFKSRIERARTFTIGKIIQDVSINEPTAIPEEIVQIIIEDSALLGNLEMIKSFKQSKKPEIKEHGDLNLLIESVSDSVYAVGKPAKFAVKFDTTTPQTISIRLKTPEGNIQNTQLSRPGMYMFVPETKGYYTLDFSNATSANTKYIKVMDLEPVLQNNRMGTLYVGIDNALNIKTSEFEDTEGLTARISNGQILQKGKNFYARVYKPGIVNVEVLARLPYGFVKVADKRFIVRELVPPTATILNKPSGSELDAANLGEVRSLQVKSEEYLVSEQFYISSFDFTIIYNNHTSILQPINHSGSSMNTVSLDALKRVKSGDVLIFNKIRAKSSLGKEIDVAPVTYTIK